MGGGAAPFFPLLMKFYLSKKKKKNIVMQVVKLAECEIYSYNPDSDADPFLERGAM
jgi:hypothetical protein